MEKTEKDLKQIAMDLFDGKIFSDRHISENEAHMIGNVFMPIALGAFKDTPEEELKNIGMIYEYLSEAGPRSINGMPMFMSFRYLTKDEAKDMFVHYEAYKKLKEEFENS